MSSLAYTFHREQRLHLIRHAENPDEVDILRPTVLSFAPQAPRKFESATRFKREQRAFEQVLQDLRLATPQEVQARNSLVRGKKKPRLLDFEQTHASV